MLLDEMPARLGAGAREQKAALTISSTARRVEENRILRLRVAQLGEILAQAHR